MNTEAEFKAELKELLKKYNVEMSIEGGYKDEPHINFFRYGVWSDEMINWNIRWMNGDSEE